MDNVDEEQDEQVEVEVADNLEDIKATEEEFEPVQLSPSLIEQSVSLISKTANGLEHCFTKLEIHGQNFTHTDNLNLYPHLRFYVSIIHLNIPTNNADF